MLTNVGTEHIIAMQMPRVITLLVHSFVHVMVDSQEVGRIVKVNTKLPSICYTNKLSLKIIILVVSSSNSFLDIGECTNGSHNCHSNATCNNIVGSFICSCDGGFTGNGTYCEGSNKTSIKSIVQINFFKKINFVVIFYNSFSDVDECTKGTDTCRANATCNNTVGSFNCSCDCGFTGNGTYCEG